MKEKDILISLTENREEVFISLYKRTFPSFAAYVGRRGGSLEDAKDLFQDALIVWFEKLTSGNLNISRSHTAYIFGTAKLLWLKRQRSTADHVKIHNLSDDVAEEAYKEPSPGKVMGFLESTGQKCMELLKAFYYDKLSPVKLAERFGFAGERSATVQKYKCLEKVRNQVKQRALNYEDFVS